jgi:hypothetical protein
MTIYHYNNHIQILENIPLLTKDGIIKYFLLIGEILKHETVVIEYSQGYNIKYDNLFEKIINELSREVVNKLQLNENNEDIYVECWMKNKDSGSSFHVDCDEFNRGYYGNNNTIKPIVSIVTYLSDNDYVPTVVTNIDEKIKTNINQLCVSFPVNFTQIVFDGGNNLHGNMQFDTENTDERNILIMNIWQKEPPCNIPFYQHKRVLNNLLPIREKINYVMSYDKKYIEYSELFKIDKIENKAIIKIQEPVYLNNEKFDKIKNGVRDNFKTIFPEIHSLIQKIRNEKRINTFLIENNPIAKCKIDTDQSIFSQRMCYRNQLTKQICEWFIEESEKYALENGGWLTNRHDYHPTTDLQINNVVSIRNYIYKFIIPTIYAKMQTLYTKKMEINTVDAFIAKYETGNQISLGIHKDGCSLTASFLLSSSDLFIGGNLEYIDKTIYNLQQGDMVIHSHQHKHFVNISHGIRYVMVFFCDIYDKTFN